MEISVRGQKIHFSPQERGQKPYQPRQPQETCPYHPGSPEGPCPAVPPGCAHQRDSRALSTEPSWPPHSNLLPSTLKELAHQANQAHLPSALQKVPSVHVFPLISSLSRSGEPRPSMAPAPRAPPQRPVPPPSHLAPPSAPLTPPYRRPELAKTWRSSLGRFNTCLLRAASCPSLTLEALTSK